MKSAIAAVALIYLTGCCSCRHLTTSTQDSVRVETIVRTERIRDTVFVDVPVERERQTVRDTMSHLETTYAASDARITPDGALFHSLENKPQKRPVAVEKEIIYRDSIIYRERATTETVEIERELTWWQQTKIKGFWILLFLMLFSLRRKIVSILKKII